MPTGHKVFKLEVHKMDISQQAKQSHFSCLRAFANKFDDAWTSRPSTISVSNTLADVATASIMACPSNERGTTVYSIDTEYGKCGLVLQNVSDKDVQRGTATFGMYEGDVYLESVAVVELNDAGVLDLGEIMMAADAMVADLEQIVLSK